VRCKQEDAARDLEDSGYGLNARDNGIRLGRLAVKGDWSFDSSQSRYCSLGRLLVFRLGEADRSNEFRERKRNGMDLNGRMKGEMTRIWVVLDYNRSWARFETGGRLNFNGGMT
jgi:hypothetical protein